MKRSPTWMIGTPPAPGPVSKRRANIRQSSLILDHRARSRLISPCPRGHELSFWRAKLTEFVSFWTAPGVSLTLTDSIDTMVGNVIDRLQ
jgi:hypothetical protein